MAKFKPIRVLFVVAIASLVVLSSRYAPAGLGPECHFEGAPEVAFLAIWTLGTMPLAFWMPRARASFFSRGWRVPSLTYLLPGSFVRVGVLLLWAQVLGFAALSLLDGSSAFWLAGSALCLAGAFTAGARSRLRQPVAEYDISWLWWRRLSRPLRK